MESFNKYITEKGKNLVIKRSTDGVYHLMDTKGKEIKKSRKIKELRDYADEKGYSLIYFNEDNSM